MPELGQDYRLFVDDGAGTFNEIAGQTTLNKDGGTNLINQSSKTTGQFDLQAPGRKSLTINVGGIKTLPDAGGLERVYTLQKVYPQVQEGFQIRKAPYAGSDVVFQCEMFISNFREGFDDQDNATYQFDLTPQAAPSVDLLAPA